MRRIGDVATKVLVVDRESSVLQARVGDIASDEALLLAYEWASDLSTGIERLNHPGIDVVVVSLDLPEAEGVEAFERVHMFASEIPIVVVGHPHEEVQAIRCVNLGAQDRLTYDEVTAAVFPRVVRYAIERHRLLGALREMSALDELTDLYSMQGLAELGAQHLSSARRMARSALMLHLDIDGFRQINETLGHDVGDELLLATTGLLHRVFRASDLMARTGPDEFAVLALDAGMSAGPTLVERLLDAALDLRSSGRVPCALDLTIGFAGSDEDPMASVPELLEQARRQVFDLEPSPPVGERRF